VAVVSAQPPAKGIGRHLGMVVFEMPEQPDFEAGIADGDPDRVSPRFDDSRLQSLVRVDIKYAPDLTVPIFP